jgi:LDH2 family malate/lactate/ureidoglycolate dehydrogenase
MRTEALESFVAEIFARLGLPAESARLTAAALVAADLEGITSHGVMLVPMYVERMLAGSVSQKTQATVVHDGGSAVVLDADNALGQLSSDQAVQIAVERARGYGVAVVTVRNGFHFGTAGFWARKIAGAGLVGIVMCNTRPLMPAPGGAERVVGNNPLAIALPSIDENSFVVDMALSATAMGRIRLADSAGKPIPEGWAVDEHGRPTTDPAVAIKGMLLPAAGPKGFGLAVAIDLLCGGLSGGAVGDEVAPLYGDAAKPYRCSHLFLALDPARFGVSNFPTQVGKFGERIRSSKPSAGTGTIYAPGDLERARRAENAGECPLPPDVLAKLRECAAKLGVERNIS